jgi:hypothetical protein
VGFDMCAYTQSVPDSLQKKAIAEGEKAGSGTKQDVLVDYLQIAVKNITSNTSNIQLKLSWFALNTMDSIYKYNRKNFIKSSWQRNGQFLLSGGINKSNVFNSLQAGFSYNILNRRDTTLHYYTDIYKSYFDQESKIIYSAIDKYKQQFMKPELVTKLTEVITKLYDSSMHKKQKIDNLKMIIVDQINGVPSDSGVVMGIIKQFQNKLNNAIENNSPKDKINRLISNETKNLVDNLTNVILASGINKYVKSLGKQPLNFEITVNQSTIDSIGNFIDTLVVHNEVLCKLKPKSLIDLNKTLLTNYEVLVQHVAQQPLLTFGYAYNYGTQTILSSHVIVFQYVQGLSKLASKNATELTASLSDTVTSNDPTGKIRNFDRNIIALQSGFNKVLAMQKKVSVMELNLGIEEDVALSGYTTAKDKSKFTFNAYFRARLPATPWLKLAIKYDPKAANVLGILDFAYNLDKP